MSLAGDIASLSVKLAYEKWKKTRPLEFSDEAKQALAEMQNDGTGRGEFEIPPIGNVGQLDRVHRDIERELGRGGVPQIDSLTNRVVLELEAKGCIKRVGHKRVMLEHFGWIVDPESGKPDKNG